MEVLPVAEGQQIIVVGKRKSGGLAAVVAGVLSVIRKVVYR